MRSHTERWSRRVAKRPLHALVLTLTLAGGAFAGILRVDETLEGRPATTVPVVPNRYLVSTLASADGADTEWTTSPGRATSPVHARSRTRRAPRSPTTGSRGSTSSRRRTPP